MTKFRSAVNLAIHPLIWQQPAQEGSGVRRLPLTGRYDPPSLATMDGQGSYLNP